MYETAAALSPRQASAWTDLAAAYELAGRFADAEHAHETARQVAPNSPTLAWQRGNFYLRRGRSKEALEAFRSVLLTKPELRRQAFDLAWRGTDDASLILDTLIPVQAEVGCEYLKYLVETGRLPAAATFWDRLLSWNLPFDPRAAFPYLDALREHRQLETMEEVWAELVARHPQILPPAPSEPEAVTNGGFETDILNGGLDWRVEPVESVVVAVDGLTSQEGARSLHVRFEGRSNLDYNHISQYVPVRPTTPYRFKYSIRTRGLTTDSGLRFELTDAYDPAQLSLLTRNVLGSPNWSLEQAQFTTGPATRLLRVRLVRLPSRKFDNKIAGSVWIDQVSLTRLAPSDPTQSPH